MRVFLVFLFAFLSWHFSLSQNLPGAHKGTLMYRYYKIDYNQARRLHKKSTNNIDSFLTNLVLEVPNDSFGKILPQEPGNYILAWMQNTTLYYKSYNKPFLYAKTSGVLGEGQLKLYSFEGNLIRDAVVKLNTKKKDWEVISFDEGCACYSFNNEINNKLISIEKDGAFEFYRMSNEGLKIPSIDRSNPYAGTKTYPGYMVFNKPKYRHFDTLKMKAFVVNTDGKPLRRKLDVVLYANYETKILATIKPETPGAYVYDFVISDSLRLNSNITVSLKYYHESIKQNSVIIEDYELKKAEGIVAEQVIRPTGLLDPPIEVRPSINQIDDLLEEIELITKKNERVLVTTLTKRMAEELAKFMARAGVRCRYIHSDVDTLERVDTAFDMWHY